MPGTEMNKAALGVDIRSGQSFKELERVLSELDEAGPVSYTHLRIILYPV